MTQRGSRRSRSGNNLLASARHVRWRVPELALQLSNRAAAEARRNGDSEQRLRAEALALFAENRLCRSVAVTQRAITALRDAETAGIEDTAAELRVELACCARRSGGHDVALRVLSPLLRGDRLPPDLRAHGLLELSAALPMHRKAAERLESLDEAERLFTAEASADQNANLLQRARVCAARAAHYRGHGEFTNAVQAASTGLELLARLGDGAADSGEMHASLVLEQAHALLDLGKHAEAARGAAGLLQSPLRAAAAAPVGWLRLALATRVHLPAGEHGTAIGVLTEAYGGAYRHDLVDLQAEVLNALSHLHEKASATSDALRCLRDAYAADRRWRAHVQHARVRLLEEFPADAGDERRHGHAAAREVTTAAEQTAAEQTAVERTAAERSATEPADAGEGVAEAGKPASTRQQPTELAAAIDASERIDTGGQDVRQAARRLMDSLTGKSGDNQAPAARAHTADGSSGSDRWTVTAAGGGAAVNDVGSDDQRPPARSENQDEREGSLDTAPSSSGGRRRRDEQSSSDDGSDNVSRFRRAAAETRSRKDTARVDDSGANEPWAPQPRHEGSGGSVSDPGFPPSTPDQDSSAGTGSANRAIEWPPQPLDGSGGSVPAVGYRATGADAAPAETPDDEDITTIMPVIPVAPSGPSSEADDTSPAGDGSHSDRARRTPEPEFRSQPQDSASYSPTASYSDTTAYSDSVAMHAPWPESDEHDESNSSWSHSDEGNSRRAQGRSLAEIRAALTSENGGVSGHDPLAELLKGSSMTGRRRRYADEEPDEQPESSAWSSAAERAAGAAAPDYDSAANSDRGHGKDVLAGLPDLGSVQDHSNNDQAGLADLLAEALVAYQNGNPAPQAREVSTSGPVEAGNMHRSGASDEDEEDAPPRRRHAVGETETENSRTWTPRVR